MAAWVARRPWGWALLTCGPRFWTAMIIIGIDAEGDTMEIQVADDGLDPGKTLEKQQRVNRMREVVAQLKPRYRRLVELRYFEEYSYDEISKELNLPLGTVKAQLFRARDILAGVLEIDREHF